MKVVVAGCGFHGRGIAYQLSRQRPGIDLLVVDDDPARARAVGAKAGVPWQQVDVTDRGAVRELLGAADVVVNAVGPYHRTALAVIEVALETNTHYVDMNDDHEVAEALLLDRSWDDRARRAGLSVLIDCGVVPGLSGMLVRYASDQLDDVGHVTIRFAWNYNRAYPAAVQHFLRINSGRGMQYLEGSLVRKGPFEGPEKVHFLEPVGATDTYFTGVPDPVAISRSIPGVVTATAKGAFYQPDANRLLEDMIRWGFAAYDAPDSRQSSPMDYLIGYLSAPQGEPYFDIPRREVPLALRVEVTGSRSAVPTSLNFEVHDHSRRATTTFTALAAQAVIRGELTAGVHTPEAWPTAAKFLQQLQTDPHIQITEWRDDGPTQRRR
jgi:saccharopine dehydrogenase-like NADP-dependent oxidoreductase